MRFHTPHTMAAHPGRPHRIELKLHEVSQLFNSMDPSPFNDKDLDHDAEEFIVSWAHEYPPDEPVMLHVHLEHWPDDDPAELVREAVHNYFSYRTELNRLEFRRLMKQGRMSLFIGLGFLALCLMLSNMLPTREPGTLFLFLKEGLDYCRLGRNVETDADIPL